MKRLALLLMGFVIAFSFSTAYAEGVYVSGSIGGSMVNDSEVTDSRVPGVSIELDSDLGWAAGIAVGYDFGNNMRLEGELAFLKNALENTSALGVGISSTGDIYSQTVLINGYYDFMNKSSLIPFVGVGIGYADVEVNDYQIAGYPIGSADDKAFAYQVSAGITYVMTEKLKLDFKYRLFGTSDLKTASMQAEYMTHSFLVGLRFGF